MRLDVLATVRARHGCEHSVARFEALQRAGTRLARCAQSQSLPMTSEIQARGAPFRQRTCFSTVSKLYQNHISTKHWGCPSSEEQIPQMVGKTEKTRNGMDGLEGSFTRPRQVRYQAALRPDYIDSTSVARFKKLRVSWVLIQRTCFQVSFPQHRINILCHLVCGLHFY